MAYILLQLPRLGYAVPLLRFCGLCAIGAALGACAPTTLDSLNAKAELELGTRMHINLTTYKCALASDFASAEAFYCGRSATREGYGGVYMQGCGFDDMNYSGTGEARYISIQWSSVGETLYSGCGKRFTAVSTPVTASGAPAVPGRTIAVDPGKIPLGSHVLLDFVESGEQQTVCVEATDKGSAIQGNDIDYFLPPNKIAFSDPAASARIIKTPGVYEDICGDQSGAVFSKPIDANFATGLLSEDYASLLNIDGRESRSPTYHFNFQSTWRENGEAAADFMMVYLTNRTPEAREPETTGTGNTGATALQSGIGGAAAAAVGGAFDLFAKALENLNAPNSGATQKAGDIEIGSDTFVPLVWMPYPNNRIDTSHFFRFSGNNSRTETPAQLRPWRGLRSQRDLNYIAVEFYRFKSEANRDRMRNRNSLDSVKDIQEEDTLRNDVELLSRVTHPLCVSHPDYIDTVDPQLRCEQAD